MSITLFILSGFFLISVQPVYIRSAQDLLPNNMGLASSLIPGFAPGVAGITMMFPGKHADMIGIVALINYELPLLVLAALLLFSFPAVESKIRNKYG
ncbi:MAG: hypothetical protein JW770_00290 [Actinobacteria bacterium]|nr:hypothetical protein [Actinomycetota bacterium]